MRRTWTRVTGRSAPILAIGLVGILVAAPSASGQSAVDQYLPEGNPAGGSGGAGGTLANPVITSGGNAPRANKVAAYVGPSTDKGGRLPGTDYPSTPFLWIVLAILVAGALIRITTSLMKRRGIWGTS
ncbi:MAG TPA: hypothetical protein VHU24_07550 [Solirubrobacterales bacterium]|nr:hypothetical protein [Solirubrobacterales bacterium]